MSDKKYTYKGKEYTYSDLQSKYGDQTDKAIEKFGFKESIPESKYSYNGKEYTYSDLESKYGDKTKQAIEKFGFEEVGVKKKESTSIVPQQNLESKSESISLDYGKRNDGTKKGKGYFGELKMKDGSNNIATEISIGVNIDGKEIEIPTLVPSLSASEKDWLLKGNDPNDRSKIGDIIANKAIKHARERINEGKSPFYEVDTKGQSKYKNAKEGTMAWNQEKIKQSNPEITNLFDQYKTAKSVSEEKKQDIVKSVDDEIEQKGFWNNTKLYSKKAFNATLDYLGQATGMSYLLGDGEVSDKLKLETKPLGEELKEVDKQHKEAISLAKKNNEPIPTFTEEQRLAKARELKIEKKVASQSESQVRSFLKKSESKVDSFKQSDKDKLHLFQQSELASLSEKDKVNLAEQNIQRLEINNLQNEVKHLISRAEKGEISQEEYIQQGTVLDTRYRTTIQEALMTYDKYVTNQKDIGDVKDNIDVMKRNYGWLKNFVDSAGATGADLTAGLINTGGWIDEVIGNDDPYLKNKTRQMAKVFTDIATDAREGIAKPIQVENINTLSDFGQWFSNTALASQVPIYAAVAIGVGGIGALGVSATGTQWNEMQKDEDEGKADYNYWQKTFVPVGYGASETISAYVDRLVMLNSARIIRSATSPERSLIAKGMWEGIKNTSKEIVKNASYEGLDETATEIMQNMMDIYALDKKDVGVFDNVLDAAAAGAVMGALMPIGATVVSKAVKPFSVDSKLASINKEILSLEKALDSSTLTQIERSTIESQLQKAKVKNQALLESHVSDISEMSNEEFDAIRRIERTQSNLREQAKEIGKGDLNQELKDQIISNLKEEFESVENQRIGILNGDSNALLNLLDPKEVIRLKDEAARELMQEKNPNGDKEITIEDKEISDRALSNYKKGKVEPSTEETEHIINQKENISEEKGADETAYNPQDDLDFLESLDIEEKAEVETELNDSSFINDVVDNGNRYTFNGEEGVVTMDGQQVVFETNNTIHELGTIESLSDTKLLEFGIEEVKQLDIIVNDDNSVNVEGKTFTNPHENYMDAIVVGKDGSYSINLENEKGQSRTIRGQRAEQIAYNYHLKNLENATEQEISEIERSTRDVIETSNEQTSGDTRKTPKRKTKKQRSLKKHKEPLSKSEREEIELNNLIEEEAKEKESRKIKLSDNGTDYYSEVDQKGKVYFVDDKGISPSETTHKKLALEYSKKIDLTIGKKAAASDNHYQSSKEVNKHIAENSNSPVEIAETIVSNEIENYRGDLDYKSRTIAENLGYLNRDSFIQYSDENHIKNNGSIPIQYLRKDGASLDTKAKELSEIASIEITEQDIVDFILDNPTGTQTYLNNGFQADMNSLKARFEELTGLPATAEILEETVRQGTEKLKIEEQMTSIDFMSEQELLHLLDQRKQYEQETVNTRTEGVRENENSKRNEGESSVQQDGARENQGVEERRVNLPKTIFNKLVEVFTDFFGAGHVHTDISRLEKVLGQDPRNVFFQKQWEELNTRFNEELSQLEEGSLPKGHVFNLGNPTRILQAAGIPNLPIEMASARLFNKSNQDNHPFELSEIKDLAIAVQNPLAVFRSATHIGSNVILTELEQRGKNFVVAIETNRNKGKISVNSIRSIHPRTTSNIINWINEGLMDYGDKEKLSNWLVDKRKKSHLIFGSTPANAIKQLISATNLLQKFENPKVNDVDFQVDYKKLASENKYTQPKVPTQNIFFNDVEVLNRETERIVGELVDEGRNVSIQTVDVADIIPTQKNVNINNLKDVQDIRERPLLFKQGEKYYVIDGHHRISNDILDGERKIEADVYNSDTQFMRTSNGTIWGATYLNEQGQREIYINEEALSPETLLHEVYHPFDSMMYDAAKNNNVHAKSAIYRLNQLAKEYGYLDKVKSNTHYASKTIEEQQAEARVQMIGEVGNKQLDQTFYDKLETAVIDAIKWLANQFGISLKDYSSEQILNLKLEDIVKSSLASANKGEFNQKDNLQRQNAENSPSANVQNRSEVSPSEITNIDKFIDNIDKAIDKLDQFGKENLGVNLPLVVARQALTAMKLAAQTTKVAADIVSAGLNAIKQTDWYKGLTAKEQKKINLSTVKNLISESVKAISKAESKIQDAQDVINDLKTKIKEKSVSDKELYDQVVSAINDNKLVGKLTPTETERLIKYATRIFTKGNEQGRAKAFEIFSNEYLKISERAKERNKTKKEKSNREVVESKIGKLLEEGKMEQEIIVSFNDRMEKMMAKDYFERQKEVDPKEAKQQVDESFERSRNKMEELTKPKFDINKLFRGFVTKFFDRQFLPKFLLNKAGGRVVRDYIVTAKGAAGYAKYMFEQASDKIYKGLTSDQINLLDKVIQLKRFIAIDENRRANDLSAVVHPDYINENVSKSYLESLQKELGDKVYNDLIKRADAYFETFRDLLDQMQESGIISKESRDRFFDIDYQPRQFLEFMQNAETETAYLDNGPTTGLGKEQIQRLEGGLDTALVSDSRYLLAGALNVRAKTIAMNNTNKRLAYFMSEQQTKVEELKSKEKPTKKEKDVIKYFDQLQKRVKVNPITHFTDSGKPVYKYSSAPNGYANAYYWVDGVKHSLLMEKEFHEQYFDALKKMSHETKEKWAMRSGTGLVKSIATGNNPTFFITNTPRDFLFISTFSEEYGKNVLVNMAKLTKDAVLGIRDIKQENDTYQNFVKYGGMTDFLMDQGKFKNTQRVAEAFEKVGVGNKGRERWNKVISAVTLQKMQVYSEIGFRMGVFRRSITNQLKELGLKDISEVESKQTLEDIYNTAASSARNTMDFNQGGTVTKDLDAFIPYLNAAAQGTRVMFDNFRDRPIETTLRVTQAAAFVAPIPIGLSLMFLGSSERGEDEKELSSTELYNKALKGVSKYDRSNYFIVFTGNRNKNGEFEYYRIAKAQQLTPFFTLVEGTLQKVMRESVGDKESGTMIEDLNWILQNNISPVEFAVTDNLARNPLLKAALSMSTGYDFFREQDISPDRGKVPVAVEGFGSKSVEEFYKKIGETSGWSPARMKAAVESIITTPSTSPYVGMIYGGMDAMFSDKDTDVIMQKFAKDMAKSSVNRVVKETSEYNRRIGNKEKIKDAVEKIETDRLKLKLNFNTLVTDLKEGKITQKQLTDEINTLAKTEPFEAKRIANRVKDQLSNKNTPAFVFEVKYANTAKERAVLLADKFGDALLNPATMEEKERLVVALLKKNSAINKETLVEYEKLVK